MLANQTATCESELLIPPARSNDWFSCRLVTAFRPPWSLECPADASGDRLMMAESELQLLPASDPVEPFARTGG